jgi:2-methylisocitrate lyase-like PEP mutase family enzyme
LTWRQFPRCRPKKRGNPWQPSPPARLRELLAGPRFIPALGIWDPYTARVAEALGIQCVHIGGYQLGAHYVISEPMVSLTELSTSTCHTASAVRNLVTVER